jgi:hypothetical protein
MVLLVTAVLFSQEYRTEYQGDYDFIMEFANTDNSRFFQIYETIMDRDNNPVSPSEASSLMLELTNYYNRFVISNDRFIEFLNRAMDDGYMPRYKGTNTVVEALDFRRYANQIYISMFVVLTRIQAGL